MHTSWIYNRFIIFRKRRNTTLEIVGKTASSLPLIVKKRKILVKDKYFEAQYPVFANHVCALLSLSFSAGFEMGI